jgi:hypothetical protein
VRRRETAARVNQAQIATARAAKTLTKKLGLSSRDAGVLLGLSHERVVQIAG